ncbi:MAG: hypothetical protein WC373_06735 [Smithella sp.]|jgi:hypothetical protein
METDDKKKPVSKIKKLPVRVVSLKSNTALVEYSKKGYLNRRYIPDNSLELSDEIYLVDEDVLEMGIQYGIEWESELHFSVSVEDMANSLRKAGLWTPEDVEKNPQIILTALMQAYSIDLAKIFEIARKYKSERTI